MTVTTLASRSTSRRNGLRPDGAVPSLRPATVAPNTAIPLRLNAPGHPINITIELALPVESASREFARTLEALRAMLQEITGASTFQEIASAPTSRVVADPAPHPTRIPSPEAPVRIFPDERVARLGRDEIALSRLEFDLLLFLADHPRQVFTRRQLLESVWGYTQASRRTVDVHVRRLRAKFDPIPVLATVRGVGYRLGSQSSVAVVRHRAAA